MAATDFVMPKLGLTMTEGKVARWGVAPGGRFAAGDIIVVVETDKIAYDVEAPAAGVLREVLVPEGVAVPVGTPLGRWDVGDVKFSLEAPQSEAARAPAPELSSMTEAPPVSPASASKDNGQRTIATPYARRLARQGGIDLRNLTGTGPKGRIKAVDVTRAIAARHSEDPSMAALPASVATEPSGTALCSAGIQVDVTAWHRLAAQIAADLPDLHADLLHCVILAAAKTYARSDAPVIMGVTTNDGAGEERCRTSVFAANHCRSLRGVIARIEDHCCESAAKSGTFWIERALDGIAYVAIEPPPGWSASIVVGTVRESFRPDADGLPVRAALADIVMTSRVAAIDCTSVQRLLCRMRDLLQAPLLLLASEARMHPWISCCPMTRR